MWTLRDGRDASNTQTDKHMQPTMGALPSARTGAATLALEALLAGVGGDMLYVGGGAPAS